MNIYIGNLASQVTEEELRKNLETFGHVTSVRIVKDKYSGISKGFGFAEISDKAEAQAAIEGLNKKELAGRMLNVSEARPPRAGARDNRTHGGS